jgi:hypothetical protein
MSIVGISGAWGIYACACAKCCAETKFRAFRHFQIPRADAQRRERDVRSLNFDEKCALLIDYLGELPEKLKPYSLNDSRRRSYEKACNWKLVCREREGILPHRHGASRDHQQVRLGQGGRIWVEQAKGAYVVTTARRKHGVAGPRAFPSSRVCREECKARGTYAPLIYLSRYLGCTIDLRRTYDRAERRSLRSQRGIPDLPRTSNPRSVLLAFHIIPDVRDRQVDHEDI